MLSCFIHFRLHSKLVWQLENPNTVIRPLVLIAGQHETSWRTTDRLRTSVAWSTFETGTEGPWMQCLHDWRYIEASTCVLEEFERLYLLKPIGIFQLFAIDALEPPSEVMCSKAVDLRSRTSMASQMAPHGNGHFNLLD